MASEAPPFWWEKPDWRAFALSPLSALYGAVARRRLVRGTPPKVPLPVLCIGNFTVGGAGKTPTAIAFAKAAQAKGLKPGIVSRGYGGGFSGVHLVDPDHDTARHTGDEPLLLARHAPVAVSPDRVAAARLLIAEGCDFLIMDDGFQSARLHIDYALIVLDSSRGIGNGRIIPAGPLRAPLIDQLRKADALLKIGTGSGADKVIRQAARAAKPIHGARLVPSSKSAISGKRFLAFAGIGNPEKFFASLSEMGGAPVLTRSFPDHHPYTPDDITELMQTAAAADLNLVTTAKDHVRLATALGTPPQFLEKLGVIDVELAFDQPDIAGRIIDAAQERYRQRRIKG
ncbi:tetraacyldisaccharide 4'-kinase [Phyllobacterium salinisoli]|uniref:Tetraacyldisaccharide 4'-kinase n=1 Tax=Phyllobacterium salinisoli TaxID=1899321 RepID=A0A368K7H9_9HYPH|nr:tetraacyldisaccharide 4'-kinase [Phyllobacterium salinisoli]RCS24595.1 tetraacyldisaccharide 4'-kinase [Phyllobacterium salinisoli]